jgi:hypothetical protein
VYPFVKYLRAFSMVVDSIGNCDVPFGNIPAGTGVEARPRASDLLFEAHPEQIHRTAIANKDATVFIEMGNY